MSPHGYPRTTDMFNRRNEFNGRTPENSNYVFASGGCPSASILCWQAVALHQGLQASTVQKSSRQSPC